MSKGYGMALALLGLVLSGCGNPMSGGPKLDRPYLEVRKAHATVLIQHGKAPQKARDEPPPIGAQEVFYPSGELKLRAWYARPTRTQGADVPAIVYFHGG